jgi:hypothetical protein
MSFALNPAAALGGHLFHATVYGGALLLGAFVYVGVRVSERRRRLGRQLAFARAAAPAGRTLPGMTGANRTQRWNAPANPVAPRPAIDPVGAEHARVIQFAFVGLCVAAGTHLSVIQAHFEQSWIYGTFFVVASTAQFALAFLVLIRPSRAVLMTAVSFSAAIVVLWAYSRFIGVPVGPDHGATEEIGVLDVLATVAEAVTAIAVFSVLRRGSWAPSWRWSLWSTASRTALVVAIVGVPVLSALAPHS